MVESEFKKIWKFILVLGLMVILIPTGLDAKQFGIKFAELKKGTIVYLVESNGQKTTATYVGKKRRGHAIRINSGWNNGKFVRWAYFDSLGRLTETVEANNWSFKKYIPFSCLYAVGQCSHVERYRGGQRTFEYNNSLIGKNLTVRKKLATQEQLDADQHFLLGKYNFFQREGAQKGVPGKWFIKIEKIKIPK